MTVCARVVPDRPGTVDLLVDGVPVPGVRPGTVDLLVDGVPVPGVRSGTVELLVDDVPVPGVRCIPGSARVSARQIEFMAHIQAEPSGQSTHDDNFQAEEFKEEEDEDNG